MISPIWRAVGGTLLSVVSPLSLLLRMPTITAPTIKAATTTASSRFGEFRFGDDDLAALAELSPVSPAAGVGARCSVHAEPSQYRSCSACSGSGNQPGGVSDVMDHSWPVSVCVAQGDAST